MTVTPSSERIVTPASTAPVQPSRRPIRRRFARSVTGLAAALLVGASAAAVASPATAAPTPPLVTAHQVASAPYNALFAMGVQVFERVQYIQEPGSRYRGMIMKRLYRPTDGKRGSARYVFLGDRLPLSFMIAEQASSHGIPVGLAVPLRRSPAQRQYEAVTPLTGRVGEIRAIGWSHRYLG